MRRTAEQQAVVDARIANHANLIVEAGAGSGKTTTLKEAANASPNAKGLYIAFNKSTQVEAAASFPKTVQCRTGHSLAYATHGRLYREKMDFAPQSYETTANILRLRPLDLGRDEDIQPDMLARLAQTTVQRYARSADPVIGREHAAYHPALRTDDEKDEIVRIANLMWADLTAVGKGKLRFAHDYYRKLWALTEPKLRVDYVMLDEAQDTAPVLAHVVRSQIHAQQIAVGDSAQQIYRWAGAVDALKNWGDDAERLFLTKSWRFGPAVADEANKWLAQLDTEMRITGNEALPTVLGDVDEPDAILCRTNMGAFSDVLSQLAQGRRVALKGGGKAMMMLAKGAQDLIDGRRTTITELSTFRSWGEVQAYAEGDGAEASIKQIVRLVNDFGAAAIGETMRRLVDERDADVVVSTAHKAKGGEWAKVRVGNDFPTPDEGQAIPTEDANLAYVSVTRAMLELERGPLSYIDEY
jgi:superfamily I DNA/RNA helicase